MQDRLIVEKKPEQLARAIHMNIADIMDHQHYKGGEGISIQKITARRDARTDEAILIHESQLHRAHDDDFRPVRTLRNVRGDAAGGAVINRRSQEGLFPITDKLNMFGPLSDIPTRNTILCMDGTAAEVIDSLGSVDSLGSDFKAIEGREADGEDIERAREIEGLTVQIHEARRELRIKQNEITSFHRRLYGLMQPEFEKELFQPSGDEMVEPYMVTQYGDILDTIEALQSEIRAISGAVFEDTQSALNLEVNAMPMFDYRIREGWNFGS